MPIAARPPHLTIAEAAPRALSVAAVLAGDLAGHAIAFPAARIDRAAPPLLAASPAAAAALDALRAFFGDGGYAATPLVLGRLGRAAIDTELGVVATADGRVVAETASVALGVFPDADLAPLAPTTPAAEADLVPVDAPVLHCLHRAVGAYGHFMLDGLAIVALCREPILAGRLRLLVPTHLPPWSFDAFGVLGLREAHFLRPPARLLRCPQMVVSSSLTTRTTFFPQPAMIEALRLALAGARPAAVAGAGLYLSRRNQTTYSQRRLVNEDAVAALLAKRGFRIVEPGNMTLREQAAAFAAAPVIVGAHGSAFANLVFARPGATVIDLMPSAWVHYWDRSGTAERWLLNLTTALGLDYRVLLCASRQTRVLPDDDRSGLQKIGIDAVVDLADLARMLDAVPGPGTAR